MHRRFQAWQKAGVIEAVLQGLAPDLDRVADSIFQNVSYFRRRSSLCVDSDWPLEDRMTLCLAA
jgi:hypothetical protein